MAISDELERLLTRLGDEPEERLRAIAALREELEEAEGAAVRRALDDGASWSRIAAPLGITRQAAQKRHRGVADQNGSDRRVIVTPEARAVSERAREEALALGHDEVRVAHMLIGIALGSDPCAELLRKAGADADRLRSVLSRFSLPYQQPAERLPLSDGASDALADALREAVRRGESELRPGHLLWALLKPGGGGGAVLARVGVSVESVRAEVRQGAQV
jgi:hypothetical protein